MSLVALEPDQSIDTPLRSKSGGRLRLVLHTGRRVSRHSARNAPRGLRFLLSFDSFEHRTVAAEAGGDQRAAAPGAAIHGRGEPALDDATAVAIGPSDDAAELLERRVEQENI